MTTNDELRAAVGRRRAAIACNWRGPELPYPKNKSSRDLMIGMDLVTIADAYLAHLDEQARREEERAKPIDREWLNATFDHTNGSVWYLKPNVAYVERYQDKFFAQFFDNGNIGVGFHVATRGQLLDLLSALGVETKGGAE